MSVAGCLPMSPREGSQVMVLLLLWDYTEQSSSKGHPPLPFSTGTMGQYWQPVTKEQTFYRKQQNHASPMTVAASERATFLNTVSVLLAVHH